MFYCENCRKERKYPAGLITSYQKCDLCRITQECHDVPLSAFDKEDDIVEHDDSPPVDMEVVNVITDGKFVVPKLGLRYQVRKETYNGVQEKDISVLQQAWRNDKTGEITWEDIPSVVKED